MLILEGAQAGLSWSILSKGENYRRAFAFLDPSGIARRSRPLSRTRPFSWRPAGVRDIRALPMSVRPWPIRLQRAAFGPSADGRDGSVPRVEQGFNQAYIG